MYTKELDKIKEVYGLTRSTRMIDLIKIQDCWDGKDAKALNPVSLTRFLEFTDRFGKVADDLAMFLDGDGNLEVNWSMWITDPRIQRRGKLTQHCKLTFYPSHIGVYRDGQVDDEEWPTQLDSPELASVIDFYRTHRILS